MQVKFAKSPNINYNGHSSQYMDRQSSKKIWPYRKAKCIQKL